MKATYMLKKISDLLGGYSSFKTYLFSIILGFSITFNSAQSQIIPSSCIAADSLISDFKIDAVQIALRKIFEQNLPEKDSIDVSDTHRDTILDALVAVYNIGIPERDSVIDILRIHTFPIIRTGNVLALINDGFLLSDPTLDSLMTKYGVTAEQNLPIGSQYILFNLDKKYNQPAFIKEIEKVNFLQFAEASEVVIDGSNIDGQIHADHVQLIFDYGWGDCIVGCLYRRYWEFKVYFDCSVEFIESYGDNNPVLNLIKETEIVSFNLYPNPASNLLNFTLKDNPNSIKLEIFDISGKRLKFEQYFNHSIEEFKGSIDVSELKKGIYFCRFSNGKKEFVRKFIKQ